MGYSTCCLGLIVKGLGTRNAQISDIRGILCMGTYAHMFAWLLFYVMLKLSPYLDAGAGPALCMRKSQRSPGCHVCCTASLNVMQMPIPHSLVT